MTESTPTHAVLGVALNPTTPADLVLRAVAILRDRLPDMDDKMKGKVLHALTRLDNAVEDAN